jgi:hypothetical protein
MGSSISFTLDEIILKIIGTLLTARCRDLVPFLSVSDIFRWIKGMGIRISRPTLERKLDVLCLGFERETVANSILGKAPKGHTILYFIKDDEFDPKDLPQTVENVISRLTEAFGKFDPVPVKEYLLSCCTNP